MGGLDAAQPLARVGLCLVGESSRAFTGAPARFTIGSVDFGGWQIHPVAAMPQGFPACDAYLVKVNYDIALAADAPEPIWVDAGFEFHDEGVAVADALPRSVRKPTGASRHTLTAHLAFDVADDAATHGAALDSPLHQGIPMPPLTPIVEVFGIGGPRIRWRYTATTGAAGTAGHVGSQVSWLALLVPAGCGELHVEACAGYGSTPHRMMGMQAKATPDTFTVRLPSKLGGTPADEAAAPAALTVRMGFVVDVVGYSKRTEPCQYAVQQRLAALIHDVLDDVGFSLDENFVQGTGDGMNVFLPTGTDISRALPGLLEATATRLGIDNQRHTDRIRLRMATDLGPVRQAAAGFSGNTIISFGRLVDSAPIRDAISDHPDADLAALVSDRLYEFVVSQGYPGLDPARFTPVRAVVKSFQAGAWLWTSLPGGSGLAFRP